jgi:hypothetical protein
MGQVVASAGRAVIGTYRGSLDEDIWQEAKELSQVVLALESGGSSLTTTELMTQILVGREVQQPSRPKTL